MQIKATRQSNCIAVLQFTVIVDYSIMGIIHKLI